MWVNNIRSHFFMNKVTISLLFTLVFAQLSGFASVNRKEAAITKLRQELSQTDSRKDSIKILYDIFDLSERKDYINICKEIADVATRAGDNATRLDISRHLANVVKNDSALEMIENYVKSVPSSKDQKETELFVKIRRLSTSVRYISEKERQERVARLISADDISKLDKYGKVERLFMICEYLSNFAKGDLLVEYLNDLGDLMKDSGVNNYALMNLYYTEAANIYTLTGNREKALEADKTLLNIINDLEKEYRSKGRKYRDLNVNRFIIYRRMLSNYEALSQKDAEEIYHKIQYISQINTEVKKEMENNRRVAAYYAMKNKRYAEAIPYLRSQLSIEKSQPLKKRMLEMLLEASTAVGDSTNIDIARNELDAINRELDTTQAKERYNELKVRYDISSLRAENAELELEKKNNQVATTRRIMAFVIVGWLAFAAMLIAFLFFWTRYRKNATDIASFIDTLVAERDAIKKRRYYDYARKTDGNNVLDSYYTKPPKAGNISDMVDYIINDVMFISSVALEDSRKYRQTISVTKFIKDSISNVEATLNKNININVIYPDPDFEIKVDKECLQMLTTHILKVAVRMAPEGGSIGMECWEDKAVGMAKFVFKHSGDPIPEGKEEKIFENFFNYKELAEKGEAALIIVRMINFLTNSSLKSSAGHGSGGKLVLMVPMK